MSTFRNKAPKSIAGSSGIQVRQIHSLDSRRNRGGHRLLVQPGQVDPPAELLKPMVAFLRRDPRGGEKLDPQRRVAAYDFAHGAVQGVMLQGSAKIQSGGSQGGRWSARAALHPLARNQQLFLVQAERLPASLAGVVRELHFEITSADMCSRY